MKKLLSILLLSALLFADTVGPTTGTATGVSWTTPANVGASDNAYATCTMAIEDYCGSGIYISSLGFAVPASATITGITATVERKCNGAGCTTNSASDPGLSDDAGVWLTKTAGTTQGANKGSSLTWSTTDTTVTLGSSSDLWTATWTPTEINAAGFGLILYPFNTNTIGSRTASFDYLALTVYYTPSGSGSHRRVVISQTRTVRLHRPA
jgi:hypothetical protein